MSNVIQIGSKVRVKNYPMPAHQSVPFTFNGLVGEVVSKERTGFDWSGQPAYAYLVHFRNIEVPYAKLNQQTNRLDRGVNVTNAENWFEDLFLDIVYDTPPPSNIITPQ